MQLRAAGAGLSDLGSQELAVGRTEKVVAWRFRQHRIIAVPVRKREIRQFQED